MWNESWPPIQRLPYDVNLVAGTQNCHQPRGFPLARLFRGKLMSSGEYPHSDADASDDEVFAELERELEDDFDIGALREQRIEELRKEMTEIRSMRDQNHGLLTEITDEKEVIQTSAKEKKCVVHFYHRDFKRCEIMNKHLESIARKYFETRFLKVFVENVPWLVEKLGIQVLPCVICFVSGVSKDRLIGFEDFGNSDGFKTAALELRLQQSGVIDKLYASNTSLPSPHGTGSSHTGIRRAADTGGEDSDLDL